MTAKFKVLVVEDEIPLAMMMVAALTQAGFDATTATSGQKGLELATTKKFDLITLDIDLPGCNGFQICAELRHRHISRFTPIVFVSGQLGENDRQRILDAGANDYFTKPFKVMEFVSRLSSLIQQSGVAA